MNIHASCGATLLDAFGVLFSCTDIHRPLLTESLAPACILGMTLSARPRKSIQPCVFRRAFTARGSLWEKGESLLTLPHRFIAHCSTEKAVCQEKKRFSYQQFSDLAECMRRGAYHAPAGAGQQKRTREADLRQACLRPPLRRGQCELRTMYEASL